MHDTDQTIAELGNEPPLIADGRSGPPDRREVSARWLSGTFLTGVTSSVLMGVALFAALDGREQLATPPEIAELVAMASGDSGEKRQDDPACRSRARSSGPRTAAAWKCRWSTRVGDRDVIRTMPFVQIKMALAANHKTTRSYPPFDPLDVFAEDGAAQIASAADRPDLRRQGRERDEPQDGRFPDRDGGLRREERGCRPTEVEKVVRETGAILTDGAVQVAALHYVAPRAVRRIARPRSAISRLLRRAHRARERLGDAARRVDEQAVVFAEEIIPFNTDREIVDAFAESGYVGEDATGMAEAIAKLLNAADAEGRHGASRRPGGARRRRQGRAHQRL